MKIVFDLEEFREFLVDLIYVYDDDDYDRGYKLYRHYKVLDNGEFESRDHDEDWVDDDILKGEIIE